jgi:hypothetical protein
MIGLDGIALVNIVGNPEMAAITGVKELQSRITHNDGGVTKLVALLWIVCLMFFLGSTWTPLSPPRLDSNKQEYGCFDTVSLFTLPFVYLYKA